MFYTSINWAVLRGRLLPGRLCNTSLCWHPPANFCLIKQTSICLIKVCHQIFPPSALGAHGADVLAPTQRVKVDYLNVLIIQTTAWGFAPSEAKNN